MSPKYTEKSSLCGNLINWLLFKHEFSYKSIVLLLFHFILLLLLLLLVIEVFLKCSQPAVCSKKIIKMKIDEEPLLTHF